MCPVPRKSMATRRERMTMTNKSIMIAEPFISSLTGVRVEAEKLAWLHNYFQSFSSWLASFGSVCIGYCRRADQQTYCFPRLLRPLSCQVVCRTFPLSPSQAWEVCSLTHTLQILFLSRAPAPRSATQLPCLVPLPSGLCHFYKQRGADNFSPARNFFQRPSAVLTAPGLEVARFCGTRSHKAESA
ncbi:uncharacterized protein B0I36DRAFT_335522 [Microdochium trichocladiopsis]|uniref:Uncharacterized protein n=1 Tax=Microdochium trichocladiopsis TaxID=1682393 RepID=A0A9P8XXC4_9PEZI|nr:uncharacterized protein B0I36DRAFT_335522 [Microdochium trichocladiopsis]KAH7018222.1 hypothetical protein B0I36DRAFT_335522 [Microdochium trichocladiopsis]